VAWLGEARHSLDVALYDVQVPGAVGDAAADAISAAAGRGVAVRIACTTSTRSALRGGVDRLDEPDTGLLDARGERAAHRRLGGHRLRGHRAHVRA
jgi:CheY-like chemotaxis protein